MNLSGVAARELVNYYKIDSKSILVIHDDMDVEVGRVKASMGGGTGGHNGLVSLLGELDFDFARIRIGVGRPERKLFGGDWSPWILSPPTSLELEAFDRSVKIAAEGAAIWAASGLAAVQNRINKKPPKAKAEAGQEGGEPIRQVAGGSDPVKPKIMEPENSGGGDSGGSD
jgi:PTH1 family peptidyl-tRNA hydrolase